MGSDSTSVEASRLTYCEDEPFGYRQQLEARLVM
jgi:hypothetical protein